MLSLAPDVPAISHEQAALMAEASTAFRKVRKAASVARFSGATLLVFAVITALGGLTDPFSLGVAAALGVLGWSEFAGARRLDLLDVSGPRRLVVNQCVLLALIMVYSGVNIIRVATAKAPPGLEATGDAQVDAMLSDVGSLVTMVAIGVYALVGLVGVPVQVLMAMYHARRGRQMRECLARTPGWAVAAAKAA